MTWGLGWGLPQPRCHTRRSLGEAGRSWCWPDATTTPPPQRPFPLVRRALTLGRPRSAVTPVAPSVTGLPVATPSRHAHPPRVQMSEGGGVCFRLRPSPAQSALSARPGWGLAANVMGLGLLQRDQRLIVGTPKAGGSRQGPETFVPGPQGSHSALHAPGPAASALSLLNQKHPHEWGSSNRPRNRRPFPASLTPLPRLESRLGFTNSNRKLAPGTP